MKTNRPYTRLNKLYALHPGYIYSRKDGQRHFVSMSQLVDLYQLRIDEVTMWDSEKPESFLAKKWGDYIHLFPREDGNYKLPEELVKITAEQPV